MNRERTGFTLIELMVSLAILAALATVAIRGVNGLQSQAKYQQTTHELSDIRSAIVGPANLRGPDGSALVSGFVADIGRVPEFQTLTFGPLGELLSSTNGSDVIPPFAFVNDASDPSIRVGVGWQGPYVQLPPGYTSLEDGWGNSFVAQDVNGNIISTQGTQIVQVRSLGADGLADPPLGAGSTTGYNLDVSVTLPSSGMGSPFASFIGTIRMWDPTGQTLLTPNTTCNGNPVSIWVVYFGPQVNDGNGAVAEVPLVVYSPTVTTTNWEYVLSGASYTPGTPAPAYAVDSRITIGPRVLKVYVLPSTVATFNAAAVSSAYVVSLPVHVTGIGGAQQVPDIVLPNYPP